jgi:hypothetical protein
VVSVASFAGHPVLLSAIFLIVQTILVDPKPLANIGLLQSTLKPGN